MLIWRGKLTHGLGRAEAGELLEELTDLAAELEPHDRTRRGLRPLTDAQALELNEGWVMHLRRLCGALIARLAAFLAAILLRPAPDSLPRPRATGWRLALRPVARSPVLARAP